MGLGRSRQSGFPTEHLVSAAHVKEMEAGFGIRTSQVDAIAESARGAKGGNAGSRPSLILICVPFTFDHTRVVLLMLGLASGTILSGNGKEIVADLFLTCVTGKAQESRRSIYPNRK